MPALNLDHYVFAGDSGRHHERPMSGRPTIMHQHVDLRLSEPGKLPVVGSGLPWVHERHSLPNTCCPERHSSPVLELNMCLCFLVTCRGKASVRLVINVP